MLGSGGVYLDPVRFSQFLSINGDGSGEANISGDYSLDPRIFYIQPAPNEIMEIGRLVVHITDAGTLPRDEYGGLGDELSNGIDIKVTNARSDGKSILTSLIKTNANLHHLTDMGFSLTSFIGGIESLAAVFNCTTSRNECLILDGSQNHKIEVLVNDDFSGLVEHHFIIHGFK